MSKRLDPEIKAIRVLERALAPLDDQQARRNLEFVIARRLNLPGYQLSGFPRRAARAA